MLPVSAPDCNHMLMLSIGVIVSWPFEKTGWGLWKMGTTLPFTVLYKTADTLSVVSFEKMKPVGGALGSASSFRSVQSAGSMNLWPHSVFIISVATVIVAV